MRKTRFQGVSGVVFGFVLAAACGEVEDGHAGRDSGTEVVASGGRRASSGGAPATGGRASTGGATDQDGATASGSASASGGAPTTGGASASGGRPSPTPPDRIDFDRTCPEMGAVMMLPGPLSHPVFQPLTLRGCCRPDGKCGGAVDVEGTPAGYWPPTGCRSLAEMQGYDFINPPSAYADQACTYSPDEPDPIADAGVPPTDPGASYENTIACDSAAAELLLPCGGVPGCVSRIPTPMPGCCRADGQCGSELIYDLPGFPPKGCRTSAELGDSVTFASDRSGAPKTCVPSTP